MFKSSVVRTSYEASRCSGSQRSDSCRHKYNTELHMLSSTLPEPAPSPHPHLQRRQRPHYIIPLPNSDTNSEGPCFELCVAMAPLSGEHQHHWPHSPRLRWMAAKQNHRAICLSQEGRKPQIKFKLFGGCVCQGYLASVLMGRQIKA